MIFTFLLSFILSTRLSPPPEETSFVSGQVVSIENTPIDAATILILPHVGERVLASGMSDSEGKFNLSLRVILAEDSVRFRVMRVGIRPQIFTRSVSSLKNIILKVDERPVELRGLDVKAEKISISGDTIGFNIAAYKNSTDETLADVLRRLPGINVSHNGQIFYQGEPISKFYIEGLDMLKGRYGIATNSLHPDDVSSIEVMERHQEIEALKECSRSDRTAINVKLKSSKRGVWIGSADLAGGIEKEGVWDGKLLLSRFRKKSQQLGLLQTNNTGKDPSIGFRSFGATQDRLPSPLADITLPKPSLSEEHTYTHNKDIAGSINMIQSLSEKTVSGFNFIMTKGQELQKMHEISTHILPNGQEVRFDEISDGAKLSNEYAGMLHLNVNKAERYVDTRFSIDLGKRESTVDIQAESPYKVSQKETPISLSHKLVWTEVFDQIGLNFKSNNSYFSFPQHLLLNDKSQVLREQSWHGDYALDLSIRSLIPHTQTSLGISCKNETSNMETKTHKIRKQQLQTEITPEIFYSRRKVQWSSKLKVAYTSLHLMNSEKSQYRKITFEPDIYFSYVPDRYLSFDVAYRHSTQTPDIRMLYDFPLYMGHRTSSKYQGILFQSSGHLLRGRINYKDVRKMLFGSLSLNYTNNAPKYLFGNKIEADTVTFTSHSTDRRATVWTAGLRLSKGFFLKSLKLGLETTYTKIQGPLLLQDQIVGQKTELSSLRADLSLNPNSFTEVALQSEVQGIRSHIDMGQSLPSILALNTEARIAIKPSEQLHLVLDYKHFYNNSNTSVPNFHLLNAMIQYKINKIGLYAKVQNLFDQKTYRHTRTNRFSSYETLYDLRGRMVLIGIRFKLI